MMRRGVSVEGGLASADPSQTCSALECSSTGKRARLHLTVTGSRRGYKSWKGKRGFEDERSAWSGSFSRTAPVRKPCC